MKILIAGLLAGLMLWSSTAYAQVSRPNPSATPQPDIAQVHGLPQPSAVPTCGFKVAGTFGDPNGCVYGCANGAINILTGAGCVFPTAAATRTAGPSASPTPNL